MPINPRAASQLPRSLNLAHFAFYAKYLIGLARERQRKVANATEEIKYTVLGAHLQQANRLCHHQAINAAVDLDKISRFEFYFNVKIFQGVGQRQVR